MPRSHLRADLNLIDLARLCAHTPKMRYDRPAGMPRLVERVDGYVAIYVRGEAVQKEGRETGARPGGLARGGGLYRVQILCN